MAAREFSRLASAATLGAALVLFVDPALAHVGSLGGTLTSVPIPFWLVVLTGGGVIGASFLFTSFATDHDFIREINRLGLTVPSPATVRRAVVALARVGSVGVLGLFVVTGLFAEQFGVTDPLRNLAVLGVWAGWWAGYTISVYLLGDSWPVLNPWRAIASLLPKVGSRSWPSHLGGWPAAIGLLALVWLEVVTPIASEPRFLAVVVLAYTLGTLAGALVFGASWFREADPVSRVFHTYGRMAPIGRTESGLSLSLPGAALARNYDDGTDAEVVFVVALLWVTSYDGLVSTAPHAEFVRAAVGLGVPALAVYLTTAVAGFALFLAVYRLASRLSRRTAGSFVDPAVIQRRFVWSLVPIAAGYHLAHFLGYFLTLSPALSAVALSPFDPPATVQVAVLPGWFGSLQLAFVVLGHLVAIWVAHAIAFETFTGRLQPIRSQYPFALVMVFYTMTSMWLVAQPYVKPPFL
ncbi:hypothetical protein [Haloarchaeobius sp. DYHT-AS-18]|uniref:hypothetical protein n=1 Tax=Haloarchaeobius sp. DYHT-AS-18 TaxID=3446117 RepID=UPI003EBBD9A1